MKLLLLFAILCLLALPGCGKGQEREQVGQFAAAFAPLLVDEAQGWLNSPQAAQALGTEGQGLAQAAAVYLLPRLLNRAGELAGGQTPVAIGYARLQELDPVLARMVYRRDEYGLEQGLAPRLDAWLHDKGYLGAATLYDRLNAGLIDVKLTDADRDELIDAAARAIVEEYYAVKYGQQIEATITTQPQGLDIGGE